MTKKGLTISVIMRAESANYGEGFGNITILKKMSRGDHNQYTYISRQALRYSLVNQIQWDNTPVEDQGVVQFAAAATIEKYPEIDLFGYMKTKGKSKDGDNGAATTRPAVARLSNAIALEPFNGDMDYLNNMGLARRANLGNVIAQSEIHASYYAYTLSIDLDRVGIDGAIAVPNAEKAKRICTLLDGVQFLYRDIKGRRENLAPLFVLGGIYERKNPYFEHRVQVKNNAVVIDTLREVIDSCDDTKTNTGCGVVSEIFTNSDAIKSVLNAKTIAAFFNDLKQQVSDYYG
ncbi:MAG: type I-B CRISPR-associated protein Cas7/Cst2/DevR [Thermoguttaceae bacterium]|nr:type I-B CRISPR-associated protein Cas7/Cst2/DevR [Thermoguttaceae bacterium]